VKKSPSFRDKITLASRCISHWLIVELHACAQETALPVQGDDHDNQGRTPIGKEQ
jgi:hypothetical protein